MDCDQREGSSVSSPIHICILTSAHPVDDVRVNHKIAQTFRSEGFRVTWVGPDYTLFDSRAREQNGIEYRLFPIRAGKLGRLLGYQNAYRHGLRVPNVDVFYAPDPDSAAAAVRLARKQKKHVIFDIHEVYHGAMLGKWLRGPVVKLAGAIVRRKLSTVCTRCDLVTGVSQAMLEPYQNVSTEKMVVRSCAPTWFAQAPPADVCRPGEKTFTLMHGKPNLSRGTDIVLEALSIAKRTVPGLKSIMFDKFIESVDGFGPDQFHKRVTALGVEDIVEMRAGIPIQEMPSVLRTCDIGLIAYGRKFGADSLPNRIFEYMAAGLPIIAPEYSREISQILKAEECGLLVDFESPSAVAEAIVQLHSNPSRCREMGQRAREAFEKRHNWEAEVRPLLNQIRSWGR